MEARVTLTTPCALNAGDLAARALLEGDRDNGGDGATRAELEQVGLTTHLDSLLARLRAHGHVIGVTPAGLFQLGHEQVQPRGMTPSTDTGALDAQDEPAPF